MVNASNYTKCVLLSDQKYIIQPTHINLHPNEDNQEFHYYPSFNNLDNSSNKVCVPNKKEDLNLSMFNMITGIDESKTVSKHLSCECKCKTDRTKCHWNQCWNKENCWCDCRKHHICEKIMFGMPLYIIMKMKNIINDYRL